ncbi:sensor histidine kinase [Kineosporia rhizophila]|uniref:sensor histidine kinase n=1 Tax=Kineosporia TaxID=49184 RepID=UPI001E4F67FF|nr:sensor histidine kinase [Kineosporia sp. NBRC 101677]MCE0538309.1 sensor histidine kinase [Kineosporia rhizophila]GLY18634.1 histidine kinase [Kineosporia sp. NBRC 101677]
MWQIVTVAVLELRAKSIFVPLVIRAGIILIFASAAVAMSAVAESGGVTPREAVIPALMLFCVAALASLPLPGAVPPIIPTLAETLTASVIIGGVGGSGVLFLPYLTVPLFMAGLTSGLVLGLATAATAAVALGGMILTSSEIGVAKLNQSNALVAWVFILVAVPTVGAWIRRLRADVAPDSEPAYADAHRLLSELHVVARQLSLGLDPRTLAAALAEDIRSVVPQADAIVLVRSTGGRFVSLSGLEPPEASELAIEDAWVSAQPVKREAQGRSFAAIPVLMGERVVALVLVITATGLDAASLRSCRSVIEQSGPRLASAMLFDDVRRLATTDERMRLAREIHDGIAQDLASVGYALDDIRQNSDPEVAQQVLTVREQLQAMVADLRMSIFDLRHGVNDTVGLGAALSEHAQRIAAQSDLAIHLSMDESPKRLPITVEVELLRIVQEAITNVRRHAQATNLWLTVAVEPPRAHITVIDDGRGLKPGRADSFGIQGMRERARRIGANLRVGPGPEGGGTLVEVGLGTETSAPLEPRHLARPAVTRVALTDPHGIPTIVPSTQSSQSNQANRPADRTRAASHARADQEVTN